MAALVIYLCFKVVRFLGEGIIQKITDPLFFNFYQPFLEKVFSFFTRKELLVSFIAWPAGRWKG